MKPEQIPLPINLDLHESSYFYIGLSLAISSTLFIGSSFVFKKKALNKINGDGKLRAGAGGHTYLKEWIWWAGFLTMGVGEVANFAAFIFIPATLVTPLGALSILVSTILSAKFLNEKLNILGHLGCVLCMTGMTIIVIHSPTEQEVATLQQLIQCIQDPIFVAYIVNIIILCLVLVFYVAPRYGEKNVFVHITICSAFGSLTVPCCKGLGIAIRQTIEGDEQFSNPVMWVLLIILVTCVVIQVNYLNKALDLFNAAIIGPIYYVLFTTFVIVVSNILLKEWERLEVDDIISTCCGFLTVIVAVFLLSGFKHVEAHFNDVRVKHKLKTDEEMLGVA